MDTVRFPRLSTMNNNDAPSNYLLLNGEANLRELERDFPYKLSSNILPAQQEKQITIKIDDEEILVSYADDFCENNLRWLGLVRGYNDTVPATHTANSTIIILDNENSTTPIAELITPIEEIISDDDYGLKTSGFEGALTWTPAIRYGSAQSYLFFKPRFPDVDVKYIEGSFIASNIIGAPPTNHGSALPYVLSISLALNEHEEYKSIIDIDKFKCWFSRNFFGFNEQAALDCGFIKPTPEALWGSTTYSPESALTTSYDPGKRRLPYIYECYFQPLGVKEEYSIGKQILTGSWAVVRSDTSLFSKYIIATEGFSLAPQSYDKLKDSRFSLIAHFPYNLSTSTSVQLSIFMNMHIKASVSILNNDFYGKFFNLSENPADGDIVQTINKGVNASIYIDGDYLFAESDTNHFVVFDIGETGRLTNREAMPGYPAVSSGDLVLIDSDKVGKLAKSSTGFAWVNTVMNSNADYPKFETDLKEGQSISAIVVGRQILSKGKYLYAIEGTDLNVYVKGIVQDGNPVNVIKKILLKAGFLNSQIDDDVSNPLNVNYSFGKVRAAHGDDVTSIIVTSEKNYLSLLKEFCKNTGLILYENNEGKYALLDLTVDEEVTTTLLDETHILLSAKNSPLITIKHIDLRYLITELDIHYANVGDDYLEKILSINLPASHQNIM